MSDASASAPASAPARSLDSLLLVALTCCTPRLIRSGRVEKYIAKDIVQVSGLLQRKIVRSIKRYAGDWINSTEADGLYGSSALLIVGRHGTAAEVRYLVEETSLFTKGSAPPRPFRAIHVLCKAIEACNVEVVEYLLHETSARQCVNTLKYPIELPNIYAPTPTNLAVLRYLINRRGGNDPRCSLDTRERVMKLLIDAGGQWYNRRAKELVPITPRLLATLRLADC